MKTIKFEDALKHYLEEMKRTGCYDKAYEALCGPRTSHAQAQMDERRENDRDFPIDARIAGRSRRFCSPA